MIRGCTFVGNRAHAGPHYGAGASAFSGSVSVERSLFAFNDGSGLRIGPQGSVENTDIFGNTDGDWVLDLAGLLGQDGNRWSDPCFCDIDAGEYGLCADSPCLPANNPNGIEVQIGAPGEGCPACGCGRVGVEATSWSRFRTIYR